MSTKKITDFSGKVVEVDCLSCAVVSGMVELPGEPVLDTPFFSVHQDFEIPIPGFMILASKRHLKSIDEFSEDEARDFMDSLISVRTALRKTLSVEFVYLIQEEDTSAHFHLWIFPRYNWMQEQFGRKIESVRPIMEYARANLKTEANLSGVNDALEKLRASISKTL